MKTGERFSQKLKRTVRAALWLLPGPPPNPSALHLQGSAHHPLHTPAPFPGPCSSWLALLGGNWPTHLSRREPELAESHPPSPFQMASSFIPKQPWEAQMGTLIISGAQRGCDPSLRSHSLGMVCPALESSPFLWRALSRFSVWKKRTPFPYQQCGPHAGPLRGQHPSSGPCLCIHPAV